MTPPARGGRRPSPGTEAGTIAAPAGRGAEDAARDRDAAQAPGRADSRRVAGSGGPGEVWRAFGRRLRDLRSILGVSQDTVSGWVGKDRSLVSKWEAGAAVPGADDLRAMLAGMRSHGMMAVDADFLLFGTGHAPDAPEARPDPAGSAPGPRDRAGRAPEPSEGPGGGAVDVDWRCIARELLEVLRQRENTDRLRVLNDRLRIEQVERPDAQVRLFDARTRRDVGAVFRSQWARCPVQEVDIPHEGGRGAQQG